MSDPDSHPVGYAAAIHNDRVGSTTHRPASVTWAVGITIVMSSVSILANIGFIIAVSNSCHERRPPFAQDLDSFTTAVSAAFIGGSIIAIVTASKVLKRKSEFRIGLTILAGLTIAFAVPASFALVGIPWLIAGISVIVLMNTEGANGWFAPRRLPAPRSEWRSDLASMSGRDTRRADRQAAKNARADPCGHPVPAQRPGSVTWAVRLTIAMSSISIVASIAAIAFSTVTYDFDNEYMQPKFGLNPYTIIPISAVVIVGSAIAIFAANRVLRRQSWARIGLTVLAGITIFFSAFASLLLVGIPWLAAGIMVVLRLHTLEATAWFGDESHERY